ncbi:major facilitator superfamily domain-containing protein [Aspergillus alliaceus]|uniref:major facilitator superfamily domain-containing protein n=1 Tax=Petromyces alliaceus TaxID=209559 RepID=UPI0012A612FE|nr:major facilitator superfamily domain-containing protein [Aspergillus alliaceus]KAB8236249.1 major facilitator superfamily domain-containing protein [Aspergillus alliaceus]
MASHLEIETKGDLSMEIENAADDAAPSYSPKEEAALVRRTDIMLRPTMWIMYLLSYMDRTNIGNTKISGMQEDLNLTSDQYSTCLGVFFIGYVVLEVVLSLVFAPGILVISSWYKKTEQSKRFGTYISAAELSGAFRGLTAAGIVDGLEGAHDIRGWRWLFIVEGATTVGFALFAVFILPDFPATTKRLSERQRYTAVAQLQSDNVTAMTENAERLSPWQAVLVSVIVGTSTLSYFYSTLVKGLSGTPPLTRSLLWRDVVIAGWPVFSLACSIAVCGVYDYTSRYALLVLMAAGLWETNGGTLAYASSAFANMQPQYLFPDSDGPKCIMGFAVISAMLAVGVVVFIILHV